MATTELRSLDGKQVKVSVGAGETSNPIPVSAECVVSCAPGSGGQMLAQATYSSPADVAAGVAIWHDWSSGTVSTPTNEILFKGMYIRFTATAAAGVGEVVL